MRDNAPLNVEEWARLDEIVVDTARRSLVARHFIHLTGPLGIGTRCIPDMITNSKHFFQSQNKDVVGHEVDGARIIAAQNILALPLISRDFHLSWDEIKTMREIGQLMDFAQVVEASAACASLEDKLIFLGIPQQGYEGLLNVQGRNIIPLRDWDKPHEPFNNIVAAIEKLMLAGFHKPFAVIVNPKLYIMTQRIAKGTSRLESELIQIIAEGGLFHCPIVPIEQAVVVSQGEHNFDLVVAQDLITAYLGSENMNHHFRVMESILLRIKNPGAICVLE
jgi:uncharacterized linocin/CFP29 family protein